MVLFHLCFLQLQVHIFMCVYGLLAHGNTLKGDDVQLDDDYKYFPIRFHINFSSVESQALLKLKTVLKKATGRVSQLLYVKQVKSPLLLNRQGCSSEWSHGINKGLCSSVRSKRKGEFCDNKIDYFQIPEDHLQKLDVYNYTSTVPILTLPAGSGINDSDYILYVANDFSSQCQKQDTQAYASYCRRDESGRPVAGYINFCPLFINSESFDDNYYVSVAIHELFHALGFSKVLFPHYNGYSTDFETFEERKFLYKDSFGIQRLMFPTVIQKMKEHFNCSDSTFGAPLENKDGMSYSSHWDPFYLYGSLMTPALDKRNIAVIDPISLAVFADSGWYKVNFTAADFYSWGKGEGCQFGIANTCDEKMKLKKLCDRLGTFSFDIKHPDSNIPLCHEIAFNSSDGNLARNQSGMKPYTFRCLQMNYKKVSTSCINTHFVLKKDNMEESLQLSSTVFYPTNNIVCYKDFKRKIEQTVNSSIQVESYFRNKIFLFFVLYLSLYIIKEDHKTTYISTIIY